jgi:hypothetical protein
MRHKKELQVLAKALFYGPSVLRGLPTPGDQYCELLPVAQHSFRPARVPSLLLYICQVFGGYAVNQLTRILKAMAFGDSSSLDPYFKSHPGYIAHRWTRLKRILKISPRLLSIFSALHVALFYFDSSFYTIAHRVAGMRYVTSYLTCPSVERIAHFCVETTEKVQRWRTANGLPTRWNSRFATNYNSTLFYKNFRGRGCRVRFLSCNYEPVATTDLSWPSF